MKLFVNFIVLASLACILSTTDILDEVYLFLPFLKNIKIPPACPINEVYKICMSPCSDCIHRGICVTNDCSSGCDCAPRFYRVTPGGPCEPVANCPKPECGENEVFRECGPICERCTTVSCRIISCDHKCYCKEGYLRNEEGKCIPMEECPKREHCYHNEKWADKGPVEEFCLKGENVTSTDAVVSQCYCEEGYKRNALGHCINETLCQFTHCFGVEIYHDCIPKCNTTCRNYGNPNCTEDDNCYPGCFCPPGYVMNDFRSCIPVEECSLDIKQVKIMDIPDEEDEYSDTSQVSTTLPSVEVKDSVEKTTLNYLKATEESVSLATKQPSVSKPTEPSTYTTTAASAEDSENSDDNQMLHDNDTAK